MLYIVSTPIGNLQDITLRALEILKTVDFIACEDTRHAGILLKKYGIETPRLSFHAHSGRKKVEQLIARLKRGESGALISDAGTPGISDPAYVLLQEALREGVEISPIPGASAFLAALTVSGLPINNFLYLGFLPAKKGRQTLLRQLVAEKRTLVFYESPHRLNKTLLQLAEYFGPDRSMVIARELTKIHEEIVRGTIASAINRFAPQKPRGEFVICIAGAGQNHRSDEDDQDAD